MPEHGVDGGLAEDAADARQRYRQQHFVEAGGHREEGDAAAGHEVVPAHIVKAAAGHGQGQEAEDPFLQGVKRASEVEGDPDREQPDGEMHQVRVRIKDGTYGFCLDTADPIGLKRLMARPVAKYTIAAQEKHEKEEKVHADD